MVESCEAEVAVEALLPLVELAKSGAPAESFDSPGTRVLLTYQSPRQKRARLATVEPLTEVGSPVVTPCFQSPKSKRRPQLTPTPTREKPKEEVLSPKKGQAPPLLADFREVAILAKVPERSVLLARDAADQMVALKAGLTAARVLNAFGASTLILEARARPGGRASTVQLGSAELEPQPVEEGCNYLHGCSEEHPLFLLAARLGVPSATAAGDLGCQYSGWESAEVAEWRDPDRGGEEIPVEEVLDAALLLQQVTYGVAFLAQGLDAAKEAAPSLEELFEQALKEILERRHQAGRRSQPQLKPRERALIYKIRGRHFGYVAPCTRMPPESLVSGCGKRAKQIFQDGQWPDSEEGLRDGMLRLWRRKLKIVSELANGPEACVTDVPDDDLEDRLLLGKGFQSFIDCLAEGAKVQLDDPVKDWERGHTPLPKVLAELHPDSAIQFQPELPEDKRRALRRLSIPYRGASTHEKVVLRWPKSDPFVAAKLAPPGAALQFETTDVRFHFLNLHKYGREGQLLCHIWGDANWEEHSSLGDEELALHVVNGLRAMFPKEVISFPPLWKVTRWSLDPFALGAYTEFQDPSASEADRDVYGRMEDRLAFAGEGALPGPMGAQCTHGAVFSGGHAAVQILAGLGKSEVATLKDMHGPMGLDVPALVEVMATGRLSRKRVLAKHSFLAPKRQRSIRVEAELMQRLDHPNIVKLLRLMEDEERLCLVIEYVPGGDMLQDILRQGRFQESHGQRLLRQLASAMSFVHSRNIVHRDLKPENILLTSSDRERTDAKITDFGISRLTMGSQDCQTYLGSRDYRAPEVVRMGMGNRKRRTEAEECAGYGKPADMWSLGVVLYVMLSGERAFDSHSKVDLEIIRALGFKALFCFAMSGAAPAGGGSPSAAAQVGQAALHGAQKGVVNLTIYVQHNPTIVKMLCCAVGLALSVISILSIVGVAQMSDAEKWSARDTLQTVYTFVFGFVLILIDMKEDWANKYFGLQTKLFVYGNFLATYTGRALFYFYVGSISLFLLPTSEFWKFVYIILGGFLCVLGLLMLGLRYCSCCCGTTPDVETGGTVTHTHTQS
ncbi:unnamed protein product [Effrenium voratum]|nr:unnamed protein product [Effrenium voratum]